jgi:hypothetical protein
MRPIYLAFAATLLGPPVSAQQEPEPFTEAEAYQALSWGMSEAEARKLAKYMSDDPSVMATVPTLRDLGPVSSMYSDSMLLLFSLVSEETNRKVEQRLLEQNLGKELNPEERADWERRRSELRTLLIKAGKLPER